MDPNLNSWPDFFNEGRSRTLRNAKVEIVDIGGDAFNLKK
jgi:hypothetical protein